METVTIPCPQCGASSQLALFETTDQQGNATLHELQFACPGGHHNSEAVLFDLWTQARATIGD